MMTDRAASDLTVRLWGSMTDLQTQQVTTIQHTPASLVGYVFVDVHCKSV